MRKRDLTGLRFGKLIVISESTQIGKHRCWTCLCDCGKENVVYGSNLVGGHTKSCGCEFRRFQRY